MPAVALEPVRPKGRSGAIADRHKDEDIKTLLIAKTPWSQIISTLGTNKARIALISKSLGDFGLEVKEQWKQDVDSKAMQVMERLIDELITDDTSRLPADKKAITYGILHDKVHPKAAPVTNVNIALHQMMDIARNSTDY